jgi:nucleoside-diphosphate-sugar epimerase
MAGNYLVTGGAGFIGSNYVHHLLERGESAIIYDNLSRLGAGESGLAGKNARKTGLAVGGG